MSHRFSRIAAPFALAALAASGTLTASAVTLAPNLPHITPPKLNLALCYTRVFVAPGTDGTLFTRRCAAGEKPGTVTVVYAG